MLPNPASGGAVNGRGATGIHAQTLTGTVGTAAGLWLSKTLHPACGAPTPGL